MQRVIAAREPLRHRADLLVSACAKHCAEIAVASDRSRYFFSRSTEIEQHDFGAGELRLEALVAKFDCRRSAANRVICSRRMSRIRLARVT
jgi:hypothetical protein